MLGTLGSSSWSCRVSPAGHQSANHSKKAEAGLTGFGFLSSGRARVAGLSARTLYVPEASGFL